MPIKVLYTQENLTSIAIEVGFANMLLFFQSFQTAFRDFSQSSKTE
jgi:transcriptional regulator GlxA family with amidase domain